MVVPSYSISVGETAHTRHNSKTYSRIFARVLANGGVKVNLYKNYVPQCFYAPKKKAILVIPDRKGMKNIELKINDETINIEFNTQNNRVEYDISEYIKENELNTIIFTPAFYNTFDTRHRERIKPVKIYVKLD